MVLNRMILVVNGIAMVGNRMIWVVNGIAMVVNRMVCVALLMKKTLLDHVRLANGLITTPPAD